MNKQSVATKKEMSSSKSDIRLKYGGSIVKPNITILTDEEIRNELEYLDGWDYQENKLTKEFKFPTFMDCVSFVVKLAPFCEANDHHPDIHIFYKKIRFDLQRFDIGGRVTDMDFAVAFQIEKLYTEQYI